MSVKVESNSGSKRGRIASMLLLAASAIALVSGCGEPTAPASQGRSAGEKPDSKFLATLKKAEVGDAEAQRALGRMYDDGDGVPKSAAKAFEWYQKAAAQGNAEAQRALGYMYEDGEGVPKDAPKALEWYQKAAAQGNAKAQYNLGRMHYFGAAKDSIGIEGIPKDVAKAIELWRKAAAQGDPLAQRALGVMYTAGEGVPKDAAKAVEWYQKAAAQGDADALYLLGRLYDYGQGVPKDAAKAFEWYQKAAAQGHAEAQLSIGYLYGAGEGVPKDAAKAVEWYQKAAVQGNSEAQWGLGYFYEEGQGVPKDAAKAVEWYQKAAAQGHAQAQSSLGSMYAHGRGVPKDGVLGYAWSNLAASTGGLGGAVGATNLVMFEEGYYPISPTELSEAQRLSSGWKKGQSLAREGTPRNGAASSVLSGPTKQGSGTVFVVSRTGQAITNFHVIDGCHEVKAEGREGIVKVVTSDKVSDLALLQIPGAITAAATIASEPAQLRQGQDVVVFGFPLNSLLSSGGNLTPGVVSALTGLGNNSNQIQITAPIQPGSSGSPVLNRKGEVVGVVSMKLSDSGMARATGSIGQNLNFAVNGQTLKSFLDVHKVKYIDGKGFFSWERSTADLADEASSWTMVVECWR